MDRQIPYLKFNNNKNAFGIDKFEIVIKHLPKGTLNKKETKDNRDNLSANGSTHSAKENGNSLEKPQKRLITNINLSSTNANATGTDGAYVQSRMPLSFLGGGNNVKKDLNSEVENSSSSSVKNVLGINPLNSLHGSNANSTLNKNVTNSSLDINKILEEDDSLDAIDIMRRNFNNATNNNNNNTNYKYQESRQLVNTFDIDQYNQNLTNNNSTANKS
mmetsp:Transcript_103411/g.223255  ORF Transcript_103411/g.223255 Transcript_103411/m.223255 type:complete len:218 (+) Transcript_103411:403-1056(+)